MLAWQSLAPNQPPAAPVTTAPPPNNYMTNYNRSLEDMEEDQMAPQGQEDQEDQEDQADPTNKPSTPPTTHPTSRWCENHGSTPTNLPWWQNQSWWLHQWSKSIPMPKCRHSGIWLPIQKGCLHPHLDKRRKHNPIGQRHGQLAWWTHHAQR